jgi:hypothetical protein
MLSTASYSGVEGPAFSSTDFLMNFGFTTPRLYCPMIATDYVTHLCARLLTYDQNLIDFATT